MILRILILDVVFVVTLCFCTTLIVVTHRHSPQSPSVDDCTLLRIQDSAVRKGDMVALKTTRAKISWSMLRESTATFRTVRHIWQGIQAITDYKTTSPACDSGASLPDALNSFCALFEEQNNVAERKAAPPPSNQVFCLATANVRKTQCNVNSWKAAGPENIPVPITNVSPVSMTTVPLHSHLALCSVMRGSLWDTLTPCCLLH